MRRPVLIAVCFAVAACGAGAEAEQAVTVASAAPSSDAAAVQERFDSLSAKQRIGQVLMPSVDSLDPAEARRKVKQYSPGGLILMAPGTARQWRPVVKAAQAQAKRMGLPPLLVATDQENGSLVRRMNMPVTLPSAMALGAAIRGDKIRGLGSASDSGALTGQWLKSAGVNIDFAPVADVNVNPRNPIIGTRSPSAFPDVVGDAVVGQVGGFDSAGVLSTAKHFPGHGDTATDSHLGLARVTHSKARMAKIDLPPFEAAIEANIPAIMIAHVTAPAYDSRPATVSKKVVTGLLRDTMGYDGLVVSDSLGMGAVASRPRLYADVLGAGVDVLLMPNDPAGAAAQVRRAQANGSLPTNRLDEAVMHVLQAKDRLGLLRTWPTFSEQPSLQDSRQRARQIATTGVTVLGVCKSLVKSGATVIGSGPAAEGVRSGLRSAGVGSGPVRVVVQSESPGAADVWVATGSPYTALRAPARQRVLLYGDVQASGWAAGRALAGKVEALGGLPVPGPKPCTRLG